MSHGHSPRNSQANDWDEVPDTAFGFCRIDYAIQRSVYGQSNGSASMMSLPSGTGMR